MLIHVATDNDIHPPLFGAAQRTFGLCRGLARRHEVRALCVVPNRTRAAAEERVAGVTLVRRRAWYTSVAWRLEQARLAPLFLAAHGHAASADRLLAALPGDPDAFLADLNLAALAARRPRALRVYTSHNVEFDHFRMVKSGVAFPASWAARLRTLEARAVAGAELVVVCGEEDGERMRSLYGAAPDRIAVVPNGYDEIAVAPPAPAARERARARFGFGANDYVALFVGSDFAPNRAALALLLERVMPSLAGEGVKLLVAGSVSRRVAGRGAPWLRTLEETPDLSPALDAADVGLNPAASGGGSNVKVPTYLGAGLAVITTPFGVRGYAALRPWVRVAEVPELAAALRERPRGWREHGATTPVPIAAYAWGALGDTLGRTLETLRHGETPAAAHAHVGGDA